MFELPAIRHLYILGEKVVLWHPDTSQVHVTVLFSVKTNFRADVASFDPRQPVVVTVFDLDQEGEHSVFFSLDGGLSKDYGIVGQEG